MPRTQRIYLQQLGDYLREQRLNAGFSQSKLARKLGYQTSQYVSNVERGLCGPAISKAKKWAKLVDADRDFVINSLVSDYEEKLIRELR